MDRDAYLVLCKERAHVYLAQGDAVAAITSMLSDLSKHDELRGINDALSKLAVMIMMNNANHAMQIRQAVRFIEGFR